MRSAPRSELGVAAILQSRCAVEGRSATMDALASHSEDELIARTSFRADRRARRRLAFKDDAALAAAARERATRRRRPTRSSQACISSRTTHPSLIAKKALRVNLSDLAAKGAEPIGFLLALALPPDWTNDWLEAFAAGLAEDARAYRRAAARRRHGCDAGAAHHFDHRARPRRGASCPAPAQSRRRHLRLGTDRRRGAGSRAAPRRGAGATTVGCRRATI